MSLSLVLVASMLGAGIILLYRLSVVAAALQHHVESFHKLVQTEIRRCCVYPDHHNPVFPLASVRHYADLVVAYEARLNSLEGELTKTSRLETLSFLPKLKYDEEGKPRFEDYEATKQERELVKDILEARFDRSRVLRDLDFAIQANLMVQRGELTISEAEQLSNRGNWHIRSQCIEAAFDEWLAGLTAEGRERQHREADDHVKNYKPTPRQQELDKLWEEKFELRPELKWWILGGLRYGLERLQWVKNPGAALEYL